MLSCHTMSFTNSCNSHVYCDVHHTLFKETVKCILSTYLSQLMLSV